MVLVLSLVYFEFLVGMGFSALTMARPSIRTLSTRVGRNWNCCLGVPLQITRRLLSSRGNFSQGD